jgi:hypothetical protein
MKARLEMTVRIEEVEKNVYLATWHEVHSVFPGEVKFEFRICCGQPALIREFFLDLDEGQWKAQERDIKEVVSPARMRQPELDNLRIATSHAVIEYVECYQHKVVLDPSDKVKKAMKNLIRITEGGSSSMSSQIPARLHGFMTEQFNEMLGYLRLARNEYAADHIADTVLDALDHYGLLKEEEPDAQSYLN